MKPKLLLVIALLGLSLTASTAEAATLQTRAEAFQTTRACLLDHGATWVRVRHSYGKRDVGGGYAELNHRLMSWVYPDGRHITTTTILLYSSHSFTPTRVTQIAACVRQGLGPSGRVTFGT